MMRKEEVKEKELIGVLGLQGLGMSLTGGGIVVLRIVGEDAEMIIEA
jgi:hypothetical protein